ncbi:terminase small subunit [Synechococcus phage S-CREM1]|nr:terminase small subunit [Synechococcus phage S-CREM1]
MSTFDGLDKVFNVDPIEVVEEPTAEVVEMPPSQKPEIQHDYEVTRAQLHNLVMKGQEAIDGILDVARSSDHPRAYEVAGQLIKNVADVADKLIDLQKKMKDIDEKAATKSGPTTVNNTMFVGSTSELAKLLKQSAKETK